MNDFSHWIAKLEEVGFSKHELSNAARAYGLRESAWGWAYRGMPVNANAARGAAELLHSYDDSRPEPHGDEAKG